ncbi:MAG: hypothetical protein LBD25_03095 [Coriobacteriales bacterium]|jgi:predicted  nucleic acid-binding Zn-ribbon protein|nr:hypothetical protein [Coriobacteriales bacterium]
MKDAADTHGHTGDSASTGRGGMRNASGALAGLSDAQLLLALQETDFRVLQLKKQLEELPQRSKILEVRAKHREVKEKLGRLAALRDECDEGTRKLQERESTLKAHMADIQAAIDTTGDYKQATALSHEYNIQSKAVEGLESELLQLLEKLDKIAAVAAEADSALDRLAKQEDALTESFKAQGGALQEAIGRESRLRGLAYERLPAFIQSRYDKAVASKGGSGAAYIENGHCSACHVAFNEGQMLRLKHGEPISECPHCHRLLVTSDDAAQWAAGLRGGAHNVSRL